MVGLTLNHSNDSNFPPVGNIARCHKSFNRPQHVFPATSSFLIHLSFSFLYLIHSLSLFFLGNILSRLRISLSCILSHFPPTQSFIQDAFPRSTRSPGRSLRRISPVRHRDRIRLRIRRHRRWQRPRRNTIFHRRTRSMALRHDPPHHRHRQGVRLHWHQGHRVRL